MLLDVLTEDEEWLDWSSSMISEAAHRGRIVINPVVYAEVSVGFTHIDQVDEAVPREYYHRVELPWAAGFLAGQAYAKYRRRGGTKRSPLADFYIGAHAAVSGLTLLTRDPKRYRSYFPSLTLIAP